jgi:hypothetical protein
MFRRGKRVWSTAALVGVLVFTVGPGRAMAWQGPNLPQIGWESAWGWIASWFGGGHQVSATPVFSSPAGRVAHEKSSAGIDPLGLAAPASSAQSDSSSQIDPDGKH